MIEVSEIQRGVGSAEAVQPGERKAQGDKCQMRGVKKTESGFLNGNQLQDKRQWVLIKVQKILFKLREKKEGFFYYEGDQRL